MELAQSNKRWRCNYYHILHRINNHPKWRMASATGEENWQHEIQHSRLNTQHHPHHQRGLPEPHPRCTSSPPPIRIPRSWDPEQTQNQTQTPHTHKHTRTTKICYLLCVNKRKSARVRLHSGNGPGGVAGTQHFMHIRFWPQQLADRQVLKPNGFCV